MWMFPNNEKDGVSFALCRDFFNLDEVKYNTINAKIMPYFTSYGEDLV